MNENRTDRPTATLEPRPRDHKSMTGAQALNRYPLLTAYLICESLGYLNATSAANVVADHASGRGNGCEWFLMMTSVAQISAQEAGRRTLDRAVKHRQKYRDIYRRDLAWARNDVRKTLNRYNGTII